MPEPNIEKAHKQCQLHYTVLLFGSWREQLLEKKYFNAKDSFHHQMCMMECSWCLKGNSCSLCTTLKIKLSFKNSSKSSL